MVFILAASSLHHTLETLTREKKEQFNNKVYSIPSLSLNPNTKKKNKKGSAKLALKRSRWKKTTLLYGMMS